MRKKLYSGPIIRNIDRDKELELLVKAKELIEEHGRDDYVVEMSQPHCMGGETLAVTSRTELDKEYIGYRGFMDYEKVCEEIARIHENANQH